MTFHVCPNCEGEGKHMTNSMRNHAYTQDEIEEAGGAEFLEAMKIGIYDVICETCKGLRVVTDKQLQKYEDDKDYKEELRRESPYEY